MAYSNADYERLRQWLHEHADEAYRVFNERLIPGDVRTYGVRTPQLRAMAKQLMQGDWRGYLAAAQDTTQEERMLQGMVTAMARCGLEERLERTAQYIRKIDNWALCDTFCAALKDARKYPEVFYAFLQPYCVSNQEYTLRFAIVMLMDHFINDAYIDRVLEICQTVRHEGYYVKMAVAWGISTAFIKQREKTLDFLHNNNLDNFTFNKAIQKMRESYRVSAEDKEMLLKLKRR